MNLRCHEGRSAHKVIKKLASNSLADAEVTNLDHAIIIKQHVVRFYVSVDNLFAVAEFDCLANLFEQRCCNVLCEPLSSSDIRKQITPSTHLKHKTHVGLCFVGVEQLHDIFVLGIQYLQDLHFLPDL